MPSGRPLTNRVTTFHGAGITAKATSASQETPIRPMIAQARRRGWISEMTLMPMNFDRA